MHVDHLGNTLEHIPPNHLPIFQTFARGYRVTDAGILIGLSGLPIKCPPGRLLYPNIRVRLNGVPTTITIHRLAAYCFFGFKAFTPELLVRHLNADKLDFSRTNLAMGTYQDNQMDIPIAVRSARSRKARAAQGPSSFRAKLTPEQVRRIRSFYTALPGQRAGNGKIEALCREFSVSRRTLLNIKQGRLYRHVA
jgi:hypothetical protein